MDSIPGEEKQIQSGTQWKGIVISQPAGTEAKAKIVLALVTYSGHTFA